MQRFTYTVLARGTGMALADALVTIYDAGTVDKATLYEENDTGGETLANPLTTDGYGHIEAFIPDGVYDLRVDHAAQPSRTIEDVQIYDLSELSAAIEAGAGLGALEGSANQLPYFAGENIVAVTDFYQVGRNFLGATTTGEQLDELGASAFVQSIIDAADAAAFRAAIGAGSGGGDLLATNNLSDVADAATARVNLGLEIGADVLAYDADLAATSAFVKTLLASASATAFRNAIGAGTYRIGFFFTTALSSSEVVLLHTVDTAMTLADDFAGSVGDVGTNPAATFTMDVQKNGVSIGSIAISTGGVFTFATTGGAAAFDVGDQLKVVGPAVVGTAANVSVTFKGQLD